MQHPFTNALIREKSPYLLQHAHNPVDWVPWGETAIETASRENKLMIISIGYSACHWCHVMEEESFSDEEVAAIMNRYFVAVKIDREERPDIDHIMMQAAMMTSGRTGWPLNVIALPDGRPIYGATYFPKETWIKILEYFVEQYRENQQNLTENAGLLLEDMKRLTEKRLTHSFSTRLSFDPDDYQDRITGLIDWEKGGLTGAPKFPMPGFFIWLSMFYKLTNNGSMKKALETTLTEMAKGGIFDHLAGGFFRYSTDDHWLVPHFEKMTYDQAQLLELYAIGWKLFRKPIYHDSLLKSIGFLKDHFLSPEWAFYSSLDADSEAEEGKYYVWTSKETDLILGEDSQMVKDFYGITDRGNWQELGEKQRTDARGQMSKKEVSGKNLLYRNDAGSSLPERIVHAEKILLDARRKRISPALDRKVITSWNALMCIGLTEAAAALDDPEVLKMAENTMDFLLHRMLDDDLNLNRICMDGVVYQPAFLDDYATLIRALIVLYQHTFNKPYLLLANRLIQKVSTLFFREKTGFYAFASKASGEISGDVYELEDQVIPSSNALMARNLFMLGQMMPDQEYLSRARNMMGAMLEATNSHPAFHYEWASLLLWMHREPAVVCIVGEDCLKLLHEFHVSHHPFGLVMGSQHNEEEIPNLKNKYNEGKTQIFICREQTCQGPFDDLGKALSV